MSPAFWIGRIGFEIPSHDLPDEPFPHILRHALDVGQPCGPHPARETIGPSWVMSFGKRRTSTASNPACSSQPVYSSGPWKPYGKENSPNNPRHSGSRISAVTTSATPAAFPRPPIWRRMRPPGRRLLAMPANTGRWSTIQCRQAFENATSNSFENGSSRASATTNERFGRRSGGMFPARGISCHRNCPRPRHAHPGPAGRSPP